MPTVQHDTKARPPRKTAPRKEKPKPLTDEEWEAGLPCPICAAGWKPNAKTLAAMAELEAGQGKRFDSVAELMADLNADD